MTRGPAPRSSRFRRLVAALLGALLLSMGAAQDGYGLHACAHHDAPVGAATAGAHGAHDAAPAHSPEPAPCTCVGACTTSADLPALPLPHDSTLLAGAPVRERSERLEGRGAAAPADFVLPFATAPPRL